MKLRSLSLKGFRSFADEAKLDFPESGLVLIRGKNADATGVSSGSGKSSILLAIAYALKYCPYDASQLQSWLGKEKLEVKLELDGASLTRGTRTSISIGDKEISGVTAVDKALFDHIGLNPGLLEALTYRPQQSRGLFLSKTNSEMQDFLSLLLDLGRFELAIEKSVEKEKELLNGIQIIVNKGIGYFDSFQSAKAMPIEVLRDPQLQEDLIRDTEAELTKLRALVHQKDVECVKAQAEQSEKLAKYNAALAVLNPKPPPPFDSTGLDKKKEVYKETERRFKVAFRKRDDLRSLNWTKKSELEKVVASIQSEETSLGRKQKDLLTLKNAKCPTCDQPWLDSSEKMESIAIEIKSIEDRVAQIPEIQKKIEELSYPLPEDPTLSRLEEMLRGLSQEIAVLEAAKENHKSDYLSKETSRIADKKARLLEEKAEVTIKTGLALDARRGALSEAERAYSTCENQLKLYRQQLTDALEFNKRVSEANLRRSELIAKLEKQFDDNEDLQLKLEKERQTELDLILLFRGFMSAIFDEVLNEIAWNANQMLSRIPNVSHVSMGFRSESITGKGSIKRAIVPYLNIGGAERPLKAALSGGMLAAVELAVDLAVRKVISARTGVTPGWLILDESFEGLGAVEKEAVMELLKQVSNDTLILVVDHSTEFKEFFTRVVEVEFQSGRSKIVGIV